MLAAKIVDQSASVTTWRASMRLIQIKEPITVVTVTRVAAGRIRRARRDQNAVRENEPPVPISR